MSKIFDNIETKFEEGLHAILTNVGVERAGFLKVGDTSLKVPKKASELARGSVYVHPTMGKL